MKKTLAAICAALGAVGCELIPAQESPSVPVVNTYTTVSQAASRVMADVNAMTVEGDTPLIVASRQGNLKAVQALLAAGADVNATNSKQTTALMAASEAGHVDIINALGGSKQLDLEAMDWNMDTALMLAVRNQQVDAVKALLALGANANFMKAGMSVLIAASYKGNAAMVQALLDNGANADWADENGETALDVAIAHNHADVAAVLRKHQNSKK